MPTTELVLGCADLPATLAVFCDTLGFRLDAIAPADEPTTARISKGTVRLRLQVGPQTQSLDPDAPPAVPPLRPAFALARIEDARWIAGRAGMRYRDLDPSRQGGAIVASHIRIVDGGPVPDAVHWHAIAFQLIYCLHGAIRVVYEDQGDPFELLPGDCVLQPPRIRHRVLECTAGAEVVEVGCPARHATFLDHDLALPNATRDPARDFQGQRFVRHRASEATWDRDESAAWDVRDLGLAAKSGGRVRARVVRSAGTRPAPVSDPGGLTFVLSGRAALDGDEHGDVVLGPHDSVVASKHALTACTHDCELLQVWWRPW